MPKPPSSPEAAPRRRKNTGPLSRGRRKRRRLVRAGRSKWKLAAGAAGLFLFIVGLKRSWPAGLDGHTEAPSQPDEPVATSAGDAGSSGA